MDTGSTNRGAFGLALANVVWGVIQCIYLKIGIMEHICYISITISTAVKIVKVH